MEEAIQEADIDALHKVLIFSSKNSTVISAYLPEQISLSVSSDWAAPFDSMGEGGLANVLSLLGGSLKTQPMTAQKWQGSSPIEISIPIIFIAENDAVDDVIEPIKQLMKSVLPSTSAQGLLIPPGPVYGSYLLKSNALGDITNQIASMSETVTSFAAEASPEIISGAIEAANQAVQDNKSTIKNAAENALKKIIEQVKGNEESINIIIGGIMQFENVVMLSVSPNIPTQQLHHTGIPLRAKVDITFRTYTVPTKEDIDLMFALSKVTSDNAMMEDLFSDIDAGDPAGTKSKSFARNLFG